MLEIKFVRQHLDEIEKSLENRGESIDLENFKRCDDDRKSLLLEIEAMRHQRNVVSEQIAAMKKNK
jgi:seryl-tRNA synthetase